MPRRKAAVAKKETPETKKIALPKFSDGVFYSLLIGLVVAVISGAYFKSYPCVANCMGQSITNGYPYGWFAYNTYEGWQRGSVVWVGAIIDVVFWAFIAYVVMIVLYAAMKEMR